MLTLSKIKESYYAESVKPSSYENAHINLFL